MIFQSIADMIAQTASEVMAENYLPGYVYIEQYQAYYNQETRCYYYPVSFEINLDQFKFRSNHWSFFFLFPK